MNSPYSQIPGMQDPNSSGRPSLKVFFIIIVALGLGFVIGNLYVYNFDKGIFEDEKARSTSLNNNQALEIQTLKLKLKQKDKLLSQLNQKLKVQESISKTLVKIEDEKSQTKPPVPIKNNFTIDIVEPSFGSKIDTKVVKFKGGTSLNGVTLKINDTQTVSTNQKGEFEFDYTLKAGKNNIEIIAYHKDSPSHQQKVSWTLYKDGNWKTIKTFTGKIGRTNTDKFVLKTENTRFRIVPLVKPDLGHFLSVSLYATPKKFETLLFNKANKSLKEDTITFNKKGEYYLSVYSIKSDWKIVLESLE